jgi:hypothetical protein
LWIQVLTQIAQRHELPDGARIVETSGEPSPFVALVCALHEHVPAKHTFSGPALAKAIWRAQDRTPAAVDPAPQPQSWVPYSQRDIDHQRHSHEGLMSHVAQVIDEQLDNLPAGDK